MKEDKIKKLYGNVVWTDKPHNFIGMPLNFTRYILTDSKLITRRGLLNIREDEIELYRVIDKRAEYPIIERIFGCGSIILHTKDGDTPMKVIKSVKEPRMVMTMLGSIIDSLREKYGVKGKEMFGAIIGNEVDSCGYDG